MATPRKVIISCAVTGAIHMPSMSPHLPVTPDAIAAEALAAVEAGAAIVHLHARNPETGQSDQTPEAFAKFLPTVRQRSNAVVNITVGGAPTMTIEERVRPAATFRPELASLNLGSMNFGLFGMLGRFPDLTHDGSAATSATRTSSSATPSGRSSTSWQPARRTAPASNASATTRRTSTTSNTSSTPGW